LYCVEFHNTSHCTRWEQEHSSHFIPHSQVVSSLKIFQPKCSMHFLSCPVCSAYTICFILLVTTLSEVNKLWTPCFICMFSTWLQFFCTETCVVEKYPR